MGQVYKMFFLLEIKVDLPTIWDQRTPSYRNKKAEMCRPYRIYISATDHLDPSGLQLREARVGYVWYGSNPVICSRTVDRAGRSAPTGPFDDIEVAHFHSNVF